MNDVLKRLPEHAAETGLGLLHAALTDHDVFMLAVAGAVGGRQGVSKALILYFAFRRVDQYMRVVNRHLTRASYPARPVPGPDPL